MNYLETTLLHLPCNEKNMISKKQKIDNKRLSLVLSATKVYTIFHTSNKKSKLFISPLLFYLSRQAPVSHPAAANDLMAVPTGGNTPVRASTPLPTVMLPEANDATPSLSGRLPWADIPFILPGIIVLNLKHSFTFICCFRAKSFSPPDYHPCNPPA